MPSYSELRSVSADAEEINKYPDDGPQAELSTVSTPIMKLNYSQIIKVFQVT